MALSAPLRIILASMIFVASVSCRHSDAPVPRPTAYPRIALCDTLYTSQPGFPIHLEINSEATLTADTATVADRPLWFDVRYPTYRATVHCTLTEVADTASRNAVLRNRMERITLNISDHHAHIMDMTTPYGYTSRIYRSPYARVTPLQFIAASAHSIVSGALTFDTVPESPDSVMPVIEAIERDIAHAIANMY